jgi:hypothetical protein
MTSLLISQASPKSAVRFQTQKKIETRNARSSKTKAAKHILLLHGL